MSYCLFALFSLSQSLIFIDPSVLFLLFCITFGPSLRFVSPSGRLFTCHISSALSSCNFLSPVLFLLSHSFWNVLSHKHSAFWVVPLFWTFGKKHTCLAQMLCNTSAYAKSSVVKLELRVMQGLLIIRSVTIMHVSHGSPGRLSLYFNSS